METRKIIRHQLALSLLLLWVTVRTESLLIIEDQLDLVTEYRETVRLYLLPFFLRYLDSSRYTSTLLTALDADIDPSLFLELFESVK